MIEFMILWQYSVRPGKNHKNYAILGIHTWVNLIVSLQNFSRNLVHYQTILISENCKVTWIDNVIKWLNWSKLIAFNTIYVKNVFLIEKLFKQFHISNHRFISWLFYGTFNLQELIFIFNKKFNAICIFMLVNCFHRMLHLIWKSYLRVSGHNKGLNGFW